MSGSDGLRGYLVQTMIFILEAIQNSNNWVSVVLEPQESEKIDIKWQFPEYKKVVQVKSSKNPFQPGEVKSWCKDLKNSTAADTYELVLIGPSASPSVANLQEYEGVSIPKPKPLDIDGMVKQIAHDLSVYCEQQKIPPIQPSAVTMLAITLVGMLEIWSVDSKEVTRNELDELLKQWVFLLLPKIKNVDPTTSFDIIKIAKKVQLPQLEAWIQPLLVRKIEKEKDKSLIPPPEYELQNLLKEPNKVALLGGSGSGKSYMMQMAAYTLNQEPKRVCFWIPLKLYATSLSDTIKAALGWYEIENDEIIPTLERHNIVLLLDGLDEVPENERKKCITEIKRLLHSYQGTLCVSYPFTDHTYFNFECSAYEVLPLTEEQIIQIIEAFFEAKGNPAKAEWFLQTIRGWTAEQRKDFNALAQIPINLQLLLELLENDNFQYSSLRDLHGQVIKKRLESVEKQEKAGNIQPETKFECLKLLAFHSIIEGYFPYLLKAWVHDILSKYLSPTDKVVALKEIIRNDLLRNVSDLYVEWPHSSFRDYLAGYYLFEQIELGKSVGDFPLGKFQASAAGAHAVRFSTKHSMTLKNRHRVFSLILQNKPIFEAVQAAAIEYHTAVEYYISNNKDLQIDQDICKSLGWGERFLEAYGLIVDMARREKFANVEKIPQPNGIVFLFNSEADFCLATFSDNKGVYFGQLENFEAIVAQTKKQLMPVFGFCLYAPFLLLLDPEIVAYLQVGVWLRLMASNEDDQRLSRWHDGLATYLAAQHDWLSWSKSSSLPAAKPQLRVTEPRQAIFQLMQAYPHVDINSLLSMSDLLIHPEETFLSWQEIYNPITFQIDPFDTPIPPKSVWNRLNQVMVLTPPPNHISLILLMPWNQRIDFGVNVFILFPTQSLNGYYFLFNCHWNMTNNNMVTYVHFRG